MENIALSIIVPVYNVSKYLPNCLDSLVKQTNQHYEIVIIDDGSQDDSPFICDSYAEKYDFIKLSHEQNNGVSIARNKGIELSSGEYIAFVDADDIVSQDFVETLICRMDDVDLIIFSHSIFNNDGIAQYKRLNYQKIESKVSVEEYIYKLKTELLDEWEYFGYIWNKCYRKSIIEKNNIKFKDGLSCREDNLFNESYYRFTKKMLVLDDVLYNYRFLTTGLTHKRTNQQDYLLISRGLDSKTNEISYLPLYKCDKQRIFGFYQNSLFPHNFYSRYIEIKAFLNRNPWIFMTQLQKYSFRGYFAISIVICYIIYGYSYCWHSLFYYLRKFKHAIFF